jgi:hypothetical protein
VSGKIEERKSDLRNTTVMEVIIAITLILMIVIYFKDTQLIDQKEADKARISQLEIEIGLLKDENRNLKKENRLLKKENQFLKDKLERAYENIAAGASGAKDLKGILENEQKTLRDKIKALEEELLKQKKRNVELASQNDLIKDLRLQISSLKAELEDEKRKNQNLAVSLNRYTQKSVSKGGNKGKGTTMPRCQVSTGIVRWAGEIYKVGSIFKFDMDPIPSDVRNALIAEVSGFKQLRETKLLTMEEFKKYSYLVYNWGIKQNVPCRFFIKMHRKNMNFDDVDFIQKFFYRLVVK